MLHKYACINKHVNIIQNSRHILKFMEANAGNSQT